MKWKNKIKIIFLNEKSTDKIIFLESFSCPFLKGSVFNNNKIKTEKVDLTEEKN